MFTGFASFVCKRLVCLLSTLIMLCSVAFLSGIDAREWEYKAGGSALLYQNIYSFQSSLAGEASLAYHFYQNLTAQGGVRLGCDPLLPEVYLRVGAKRNLRIWLPEAGLELGVSNRARFKHEKLLLSEMQQATDADVSPVYLAFYAAPLSFCFNDKYLLSVADIQVGNHFSHMGRTSRVQLSILNLGVKI